ncbi:GAF and ANTAR domain-containing protein [Sporichthya sp.]|uniref:GAF and ANTAR domain-containing protein n=1 Tax=Sporichthya sp. TaxID=65475 RepID=UPI0017ED10F0|nr:GAF and ANTAR domain-containing protein [Sporichthya sp.]MBA3744657.1 GAF and ANTAR domain-containing protein [Sporichthya sp.]
MADKPVLRSVSGTEPAPGPPSVLFQKLSADYPDLPRRVVGEVLGRVYGAAWESVPEPRLPQLDTAARALLDALRVRADNAARRTGRVAALHSPSTSPHDRDAGPALGFTQPLWPTRDVRGSSRAEELAEAIEARARALGVVPGMSLLCEVAAEHLGVAAVAISVPGELLSGQTVGVGGALARPLEELQVVLGEGPSYDGLRYGTAVLVEDLTAPQQQARWPLYAPVAGQHGVRAQFVFPMQVGAARLGVLVLYLDRAGALRSTELTAARVFAEVALTWLIDHSAEGAAERALTEPRARQPFLDDCAEIHQATGMVSVQLGVPLNIALLRIRARAFTEDRPLSDLAQAVVARTVRFQPDTETDDRTGYEERP